MRPHGSRDAPGAWISEGPQASHAELMAAGTAGWSRSGQRARGAGAQDVIRSPEPRAGRPAGMIPTAQPRGARVMLTSVQTLDPQA